MSLLTDDEQDKLGEIFAESWARDAERDRKRRIETGDLDIELECAPEDPPVNSGDVQAELNSFSNTLRGAGISFSQTAIAFDAMAADGYSLEEFTIRTLGPSAIGVVTAAVSGWFAGRASRKVRLTFGDVEAEGRTPEEVERLLKSAAAFRASIKEIDKDAR